MALKVLIVDDSPVARRMLRKSLPTDRGYEIFEAVDGVDGVEQFIELIPDITFMDLTMPNMDGYEAIEEIRKNFKSAVIIVLTADIQPESIKMVMSKGVFTVLKKPAKPETVRDILDKAEIKIRSMSQ